MLKKNNIMTTINPANNDFNPCSIILLWDILPKKIPRIKRTAKDNPIEAIMAQYIFRNPIWTMKKGISEIKAPKAGVVEKINSQNIGIIAMELGAGRASKESIIDLAVGIVLNKKRGDKVSEGDVLAYIHANDEAKAEKAAKDIIDNYIVSDEYEQKIPLIYDIIR